MPISTSWYDDEQRVIFQKFEGSWTWEDLGRGQEQLHTMASSVPYDVVLVGDLSHTSFMPQGNALSQGRTVFTKFPGNINPIIVVIQSRMIEVFTKIALDMVPGWRERVKFVRTLDEAKMLVAEAVDANRASSGAG